MLSQAINNSKAQKLCEKTSLFSNCNPDQGTDQPPTVQAKAAIQLDILGADESPKLRVQPVPHRLEIEPGRYYFGVEVAGGSWTAPLQLTSCEIQKLLKQAAGMLGGAE